ncbi:phosphoserine phosphatase RsbP [mine drainage metagenome]|uniref:Phosphoserine phosphatase RsbP n=1 Tax=mine drainage metagenome TaxID=410659 RepID=A0A1J5RJQ5_9ZZZZ
MSEQPIPVLIVDDDPSVGAWLQLLVRRMGDSLPCTATWVTTGAMMTEELARHPYDLVLLDYHLQDVDGLALLSQIQDMPKDRRPAVIMLTGGGSEQIAVEAMKRGARDYLIKATLDQATIRRAMAGALETRRLEVELARRNEELRQKNAQMEAELAMARDVQKALLPSQYPVVPRNAPPDQSALRFAHRWIPSSAMAGDFFEVFPVAHTAAGVFLCDVMGHGVRAALVTALMRGLLEETVAWAAEPGRMLEELNRALRDILQRSDTILFATGFYLVVDATRRELRYANAAHPSPVLIRRSAGVVEYLASAGGPDPAIALLPDADYATHSVMLSPGDAVLLFTDGLHEAENAQGEAFGAERLLGSVRARMAMDREEIMDGVLEDLRTYLGAAEGTPLEDDVCMVLVELAAASAGG